MKKDSNLAIEPANRKLKKFLSCSPKTFARETTRNVLSQTAFDDRSPKIISKRAVSFHSPTYSSEQRKSIRGRNCMTCTLNNESKFDNSKSIEIKKDSLSKKRNRKLDSLLMANIGAAGLESNELRLAAQMIPIIQRFI